MSLITAKEIENLKTVRLVDREAFDFVYKKIIYEVFAEKLKDRILHWDLWHLGKNALEIRHIKLDLDLILNSFFHSLNIKDDILRDYLYRIDDDKEKFKTFVYKSLVNDLEQAGFKTIKLLLNFNFDYDYEDCNEGRYKNVHINIKYNINISLEMAWDWDFDCKDDNFIKKC